MEKNLNCARESNSSFLNELNTKGCCFLCLTPISNDIRDVPKPSVSLKTLQRYFRMATSKVKKKVSSVIQDGSAKPPPSSQQKDDFNVKLCDCCTKIVGSFKDAFLSLEKAQMEVDYWSGMVHHQIQEGSKRPDVVQNYSKRMTSDPETLIQLVFVDNLRKEIAKKSLIKRVTSETKIYLHQTRWTPKKHDLENDEDKMNRRTPMERDSFNDDVASEENDNRHSTLSVDGDAYSEMDSLTIATIKEEKPDTSPLSVSSYRPSLSSSEPQTKTKLVPSRFAEVLVKDPKTGSYSCTSCNKQLKSKSSAKLHYEAIHLGKRYTCQICGGKFTQIGNLNTHKKSCNGKKRRSFSKSSIKKFHFNSKTEKYACAVCNKEFRSRDGARYHYDAIHLKQKHKCEICNIAVFYRVNTLRTHQQTCKATLKKRLSLKLRTETDPNFKFPCPTCEKRFFNEAVMKTHFRNVHLKEKNYACDICGNKYSTNLIMKRHREVVHFGRKFNCKVCNREYRSKPLHRQHEQQCAKTKIKAEVKASLRNVFYKKK